jgi:hypothetical protein
VRLQLEFHFFRLLVADLAVRVGTAVLAVAVAATDCSTVRTLDLITSRAPASRARI